MVASYLGMSRDLVVLGSSRGRGGGVCQAGIIVLCSNVYGPALKRM